MEEGIEMYDIYYISTVGESHNQGTTHFAFREAFIKKNIFLLTFVNKDFTPPPNYWQKTIEVRGSGQGVTPPPFIKVKNNIV